MLSNRVEMTLTSKVEKVPFRMWESGDFAGTLSRFSTLYDWADPVKLPDPTSLPSLYCNHCAWSPNGEFLAVLSKDQKICFYQRSGQGFQQVAEILSSGTTGEMNTCSWSADSKYLVVAQVTKISLIKREGTTFTKLTLPGTFPANTLGCSISPNGQYVVVTYGVSPYVSVFYMEADVLYATTISATLPTNACYNSAWSPDGQFLAITSFASPKVFLYKVQTGLGILTRLSDADVMPGGVARDCVWSPDGNMLVVTSSLAPFFTVYQRTGETFTKLPDPASFIGSTTGLASWHPSGDYIAFSSTGTPFIHIYQRNGTVFTKLPNLATLPSDSLKCAFSPSGDVLATVGSSTPFVTFYQTNKKVKPSGILTLK